MAQSADSAEDTQRSLMERTSLVAAEGDEEVITEPIRKKWSRLSLRVIMWSAVLFYIVLHVLLPTEFGHDYLLETWNEKALAYMPSYGKQGAYILLWGGPIFLLVFCGVIYLYLFPRSSRRPIKRKAPRASLGTNPLIVSGPFGVLSAAELLSIVTFTLVLTWLLVVEIIRRIPEITEKFSSVPVVWPYYLAMVGGWISWCSLFEPALLTCGKRFCPTTTS